TTDFVAAERFPPLRRCEEIAFWQGVVGATLVVAPGRPQGPPLQRDFFTPSQLRGAHLLPVRSFPWIQHLSPGILCFHRHSRFVPAFFDAVAVTTDFVAAERFPPLGRCEEITFWQGVVGATLVVAPGRPRGPPLQRDFFTPSELRGAHLPPVRSFPWIQHLSPGILCFHRHSRFVPAVLMLRLTQRTMWRRRVRRRSGSRLSP